MEHELELAWIDDLRKSSLESTFLMMADFVLKAMNFEAVQSSVASILFGCSLRIP
jgi:hypothetical protein